MRDSFIFYRSFYESICELSEQKRNKLLSVILEYVLNDVEPTDLSGATSAVWKSIKPQLDANNKRHQNALKTKGNTRGKLKTHSGVTPESPHTKSIPNVNVNGNENVNDNVNENGVRTIQPSSSTSDFDPITQSVAKWFERKAFPPDKPHLYTEVVNDQRRADWCRQWDQIKDHPAIVKYLSDEKTYPWLKEDGTADREPRKALWIYIEFAFREARDKYGQYFTDLDYLVKPHNGKTNIDSLAAAYQRWLNDRQKLGDSIIPKYGN